MKIVFFNFSTVEVIACCSNAGYLNPLTSPWCPAQAVVSRCKGLLGFWNHSWSIEATAQRKLPRNRNNGLLYWIK